MLRQSRITLLLFVLGPIISVRAAIPDTGRVCGSVKDGRGATVIVRGVTFGAQGVTKEPLSVPITPENNFGFCADLPEGQYLIGIAGADWLLLPFRRSAVKVKAGTNRTLNIWPVFRGGIALAVPSDYRLPDPVVLYQSVALKAGAASLDLRYATRVIENGAQRYDGPGLMVTFDFITVIGSRCVLDANGERLEVTGETVLVEDGIRQWKTRKVTFDLVQRVISFSANELQQIRF